MPINSMIPLHAEVPTIVSPVNLEAAKQMKYATEMDQLRTQMAFQQLRERNAMAQALQQPGAVGPNGQLSPALVRNMMASPEGMKMLSGYALEQKNQQTAALDAAKQRQLEHARLIKTITPVSEATLGKYQDLVKNGVGVEEALKQATAFRNQTLDTMQQSGELLPDQVARFKGAPFNPYLVRARLAMLKGSPFSRAPITRTIQQGNMNLNQQYDPVSGTFNTVGEGPHFKPPTNINIGVPGEVNGLDPTGLPALSKGQHWNLGTTNGGKTAVAVSTDGQAMQQDPKTMKWKKIPVPTNYVKLGASSGRGFGSAFERIYNRRTMTAGAEVVRGLGILSKMQVGQTGGFFSGWDWNARGFIPSFARAAAEKLTPQNAQMYNSTMSSLALELGTLIQSGMRVNETIVHEIDSGLKVHPGDTKMTGMFNVAYMAARARTALETFEPLNAQEQAERMKLLAFLDRFPQPMAIMKKAHDVFKGMNIKLPKGDPLSDVQFKKPDLSKRPQGGDDSLPVDQSAPPPGDIGGGSQYRHLWE